MFVHIGFRGCNIHFLRVDFFSGSATSWNIVKTSIHYRLFRTLIGAPFCEIPLKFILNAIVIWFNEQTIKCSILARDFWFNIIHTENSKCNEIMHEYDRCIKHIQHTPFSLSRVVKWRGRWSYSYKLCLHFECLGSLHRSSTTPKQQISIITQPMTVAAQLVSQIIKHQNRQLN